jgi:hypothetical protein
MTAKILSFFRMPDKRKHELEAPDDEWIQVLVQTNSLRNWNQALGDWESITQIETIYFHLWSDIPDAIQEKIGDKRFAFLSYDLRGKASEESKFLASWVFYVAKHDDDSLAVYDNIANDASLRERLEKLNNGGCTPPSRMLVVRGFI